MLHPALCFYRHVETNNTGDNSSSVSPAGLSQNNPFWTAPKALQKLHQKMLRKMQKRYEDRQVLNLRLSNCIAELENADEHMKEALRNWQISGNARRAHMSLLKAEFALKGVNDNLG